MWKVTWRGLWGKKLRFLLTSMAITFGVAFMAGTLVFTDTIGRTFDDLFADVNRGTDAYVRGQQEVESNFGNTRPRISADLLPRVAQVDGVAAAEGAVATYAQVIGSNGKAVETGGAPNFAFNTPTVAKLNSFVLQGSSRYPATDDQIAIDVATAKKGKLQVGDRVKVLSLKAPKEYELVGVVKFGTADSPGGASVVLLTLPEVQRIGDAQGKLDAISVVTVEGVSQRTVTDRIERALAGQPVEVLTGAEITKETQSEIRKSFAFFNTFLLVFAGISLFVGIFLIYNTFTIIIAQRLKEFALLRAIGALPSQLIRSILGESVLIGVFASILGVIGGVGVSALLKLGLGAVGISIPSSGIVLLPRTVVISMTVGITITVLSGVLPALRAGRIPPIAAMRDIGQLNNKRRSALVAGLPRLISGIAITALGVGLLLVGLFADVENAIAYVGGGAGGMFVGVFILSPVFARPLSRVLGSRFGAGVVLGAGVLGMLIAPVTFFSALFQVADKADQAIVGMIGAVLIGAFGWLLFRSGRPALRISGDIARQNAARNPRRTAATASALMIGVALVSFIAIFAQSIKASIADVVDNQFAADFVVQTSSFQVGLSPQLATDIRALPEVETVAPERFVPAQVDGDNTFLVAGDPAATIKLFNFAANGNFADLGPTQLATSASQLQKNDWKLGDTVEIRFVDTGVQKFTIGASYEDDALGAGGPPIEYYISLAAYDANVSAPFDNQVVIQLKPGVPPAVGRAALESVVDNYPTAKLQDRTEFKQSQEQQIDQLVNLIYGLLALAIIIALLGIANTLGLSIYERTREIGLLRAVGMTRTQLRDSIRWESIIISLLGTALGFALGTFFGWAVVQALSDDGLSSLVIPYTTLLVVVLLAILAGIGAAFFPARRAAKLDVLRALTVE